MPAPFSINSLRAAAFGAAGGVAGFFAGEMVFALMGMGSAVPQSLLNLVLSTGVWSMAIGVPIGAAVLVYENLTGLRGQWNRNLLTALPVFLVLSLLGGAAGQAFYVLASNSFTRGIGWALMGLGIGAGLGVVRLDWVQAGRGALGGAIGGFLGGLIFNSLILISSAGGGIVSRFVGIILMGALIALLIRVVQDALKSAWLLGISTGPYEGQEYALTKKQVSVGRGESNDIALHREAQVPDVLGSLMFQGDSWLWQGQPIVINGVPSTNAAVSPGDTLLIGGTQFRFMGRSVKSPVLSPDMPIVSPPPIYQPASIPPPIPTAPPQWSPPPPAPGWVLVGAGGNQVRVPALGQTTVGRVSPNSIVLSDAAVSSNHARLEMSGNALHVTDVGSTNGTFVNGHRLAVHTPAVLRAGDRVRFGQVEFTVQQG